MSDETDIELLKLAHEKIAALENANQSLGYECAALSRKVAELDKERDQILNSAINSEGNYLDLKKSMPAHNLEQQAKGVKDFVFSIEGFSEGYIQALKEGKQ
jgi:hypothetical protein